ncbi:MAG: transposase [Thermofilum sp.]|nr:transposase [Thermofilum sp.]
MPRGESAAEAQAVRGLEPRAPELEISRLERGAVPMGGERRKKEGVVEGFRVLTLLYRVSELPAGAFQRLVELFRVYRAVGALYFWSKRLCIEEGVELALERAKLLPSYYRHAFDERSQVYQFGEVERMRRPRKVVLKLPLADALHPNCGAYIEGGKLVVRLGGRERLELPLPERALKWLQEKEREVAPLKVTKIVRVQWREDRQPEYLKVQIVLRVERPEPRMPDPRSALLVYVDANSDYGIACVYARFDGKETKVLETPKLKPPNRGGRLMEAARRKRAAAQGRKPSVNYALARLSERFDARGWVKSAAARIFKKSFLRASGMSVVMNFDIPDPESIKGSYLQKTLISLRKVADNLAKWFGVYATFECYPSTKCPICGSELEIVYTKRTRIAYCKSCGFYDDRDFYRSTTGSRSWACRCRSTPCRGSSCRKSCAESLAAYDPGALDEGRAASWRGGALAPPRCPCARRAHPADAGMRLGAEPRGPAPGPER